MAGLKQMGGDVEDALERVRVPAWMIDRDGIIRWLNPAAEGIVGDVRGQRLEAVLSTEDKVRGRERFTRNLLGPAHGSVSRLVVLTAAGKRISVEASGVPLERGGHVIGVFGQAKGVDENEPLPPHPSLTPRQNEILGLLDRGHTTTQIADELGLTVETVRNHVRHLLRALGVHSRLEAVALARLPRQG